MIKDTKGLIIFLKEYLSRNPYSEIGWHNLGKSYVKIKMYNEAIAAFDYAIFSDDSFVPKSKKFGNDCNVLEKNQSILLLFLSKFLFYLLLVATLSILKGV